MEELLKDFRWISSAGLGYQHFPYALEMFVFHFRLQPHFGLRIPHLLPQNPPLNSSMAVGLLSPRCQQFPLQLLFTEGFKTSKMYFDHAKLSEYSELL